jgi:hypothetical protein
MLQVDTLGWFSFMAFCMANVDHRFFLHIVSAPYDVYAMSTR